MACEQHRVTIGLATDIFSRNLWTILQVVERLYHKAQMDQGLASVFSLRRIESTFQPHLRHNSTMADLYLSQREATVLRYATLVWGALQWWDIIDRYVVKRILRNRAAAQPSQSEQPSAPENGGSDRPAGSGGVGEQDATT